MRTALLICCLLPLARPAVADDNKLTAEEKEAGWELLFNGRDHSGWQCNNGRQIATPVEQGALVPFKSGGNIIVHEEPRGDFILRCDVKWEAEKCNSGIFLRVGTLTNPVHTGLEVQVMSGEQTGKHQMGAIYDLVSTTKNAGKGRGEWNHFEIRCEGPEVEVQLNGEVVAQMNADEFDKPGHCPDGQKHKYKLDGKPIAVKDFPRRGHLGFQDHGQKVWYKNIKLLDLTAENGK